MKQYKVNPYYGARWSPKWFNKQVAKKFNKECVRHDRDCIDERIPNKVAYGRFRKSMQESSKGFKMSFLSWVFYKIISTLGLLDK